MGIYQLKFIKEKRKSAGEYACGLKAARFDSVVLLNLAQHAVFLIFRLFQHVSDTGVALK